MGRGGGGQKKGNVKVYKVHLKGERERGDGKGEVFSVSKIQDVHVRLPPYRDLPVPPMAKFSRSMIKLPKQTLV